jgi:hypothetical protein
MAAMALASIGSIASAQTISYAQLSGGQSYCPNTGLSSYTTGAYLDAVGAAINSGKYLGNRAATDKQNLLVKLAAAYDKVSLKKWADAVGKLEDIQTTADALAAAAKPKLYSAAEIDAAVDAAQTCLTP